MCLHYNVPALQCACTIMCLHYNVTTLQCACATMWLCYNVTTLQCAYATLLPESCVPECLVAGVTAVRAEGGVPQHVALQTSAAFQ